MRTLPLLAILFVPIVLGVGMLYLWAQPEVVAVTPSLQHKQIYLNVPFFIARAVVFFVLWLILAGLLSFWSREQDRTGDPQLSVKLAYLSGLGLVVYGITLHFAAVDWLMSLQPAFHSTIFGPLLASGQVLEGFAFALIPLAWLVGRPPLAKAISLDAVNDLGSLLFTFLIIWAYMTFFQFMLIWIADLPYDVIWYLPRSEGPWPWIVGILLIFHFVLPFFLLLLRDIKRNPRALAALGGVLLLMHLVYLYYQVLPAFPDTDLSDHWMDVVAPFGMGGLWLAYYLHHLKQSPFLALHDGNREAAIHPDLLDPAQTHQGGEVANG